MNNNSYKRAIALLSAVILTLTMSGCRREKENEEEIISSTETITEATEPTLYNMCEHLSLEFGDDTVTYKECDGYKIRYNFGRNSGRLYYEIFDSNDVLILSGSTFDFNIFDINHNIYNPEIEAQQEGMSLKLK